MSNIPKQGERERESITSFSLLTQSSIRPILVLRDDDGGAGNETLERGPMPEEFEFETTFSTMSWKFAPRKAKVAEANETGFIIALYADSCVKGFAVKYKGQA